jgi:hypothetical protein
MNKVYQKQMKGGETNMNKIRLAVALAVIIAAVALAFTGSHAPKRVADLGDVFGRTLHPCPPHCPSVVINKRTSLSGEGEFVR